MENARLENMALDASGREGARRDEFSRVWENKLDDAFSEVAPYYDFASNVASLGLCGRWRERFVAGIGVAPGDRVLDLCAGTNAVGMGLLQKQPGIRVFALDRSQAMLDVGQSLARARGLKIETVIGDAHQLPFPDASFDVVTVQWATRHLRVLDAFAEIARVLKPGGCFHHCDMLRPESRLVGALYSVYLKACVTVAAVAFRSGPGALDCRDYFVRAVEMFYSEAEITKLLGQTGFTRISSQAEAGGIVASHRAVKA